ncbi:hypothetical protein EMIHUDRAFT_256578, partial [Emiliania huxleyi CCMP1516]|uniref:Uncharacterized protein n=2 Tax=Emiliania huxleyi TaxID=2903 RepID=A0A0D3IUQ3_EMIH1
GGEARRRRSRQPSRRRRRASPPRSPRSPSLSSSSSGPTGLASGLRTPTPPPGCASRRCATPSLARPSCPRCCTLRSSTSRRRRDEGV